MKLMPIALIVLTFGAVYLILNQFFFLFLLFLNPGKMRTPMPGASANHGNTALFSWIAIFPPWVNRAGAKSKPWINPLCQTAWTSQLWCDGPLLSFLGEEAHEDEKNPTRNNQPESFHPRCGERISHMAASCFFKVEKKKIHVIWQPVRALSRMPPRRFRPTQWKETHTCGQSFIGAT